MTRKPKEACVLGLPLVALPMVALLLSGCGREKDWDDEIIVQVFKPKGVEVGRVTVTASQGGKSDSADVKSFADCDSNRVRVIPVQGSADNVSLTVIANKGHLAPVTRGVAPGTTGVKIVLGSEKELEPKGTCTPSVTPPTDGGPEDGKTSGTKAVGEACATDGECKGGKCLTELENLGSKIALTGGYCSKDCTTDSCAATDEQCWTNTDGNGKETGKFCVKTCVTATDCDRSGYICTPGNLCMPQ
jgi:hypothetical protein